MKEIRITIINDNSNNVKEFKGEAMLKEAAIYLSKLAGLVLFEKTNEPAINIEEHIIDSTNVEEEVQEDQSDDLEDELDGDYRG